MEVLKENRNIVNQMNTLGDKTVAAEPKLAKPAAQQTLLVKKLVQHAQLPKRGSEKAAGYDITSCESTVIPAKGKAMVDTGLSIAVPSGHYGRVAPRSGLAVKHFIDTGAGVIDEDYRGPVKAVLFNFGDTDFKVSPGDRIAQLILEKISTPEVVEVQELDNTTRGAGGFGSTGVAANNTQPPATTTEPAPKVDAGPGVAADKRPAEDTENIQQSPSKKARAE